MTNTAMNPEQIEFALSQYLDGTLSPLEQAALEDRLKHDAGARALLEEYRALADVLKAAVPVLPSVDYDKLSGHLRAAVANAQAPQGRTYKIGWWGWPARLAVAAALLVFGFVWFKVYLEPSGPTGQGGGIDSNVPAITQVAVLTAVAPAGPAIQQISIGPSPAIAHAPAIARYEDLVISRPGKVVIAAGEGQFQESVLPY